MYIYIYIYIYVFIYSYGAMCRNRATYVFAKYDAILDKKIHINSLWKEE